MGTREKIQIHPLHESLQTTWSDNHDNHHIQKRDLTTMTTNRIQTNGHRHPEVGHPQIRDLCHHEDSLWWNHRGGSGSDSVRWPLSVVCIFSHPQTTSCTHARIQFLINANTNKTYLQTNSEANSFANQQCFPPLTHSHNESSADSLKISRD